MTKRKRKDARWSSPGLMKPGRRALIQPPVWYDEWPIILIIVGIPLIALACVLVDLLVLHPILQRAGMW